MDVEEGEEDPDAHRGRMEELRLLDPLDVGHGAVRGRDDEPRAPGRRAARVPEEGDQEAAEREDRSGGDEPERAPYPGEDDEAEEEAPRDAEDERELPPGPLAGEPLAVGAEELFRVARGGRLRNCGTASLERS